MKIYGHIYNISIFFFRSVRGFMQCTCSLYVLTLYAVAAASLLSFGPPDTRQNSTSCFPSSPSLLLTGDRFQISLPAVVTILVLCLYIHHHTPSYLSHHVLVSSLHKSLPLCCTYFLWRLVRHTASIPASQLRRKYLVDTCLLKFVFWCFHHYLLCLKVCFSCCYIY